MEKQVNSNCSFVDVTSGSMTEMDVRPNYSDEISYALTYINKISPKRADNYEEWVYIGRCLKQLGGAGLNIWDEWSRRSSTYKLGECAAQWETIHIESEMNIERLRIIAENDSPFDIGRAPKNAVPEDYLNAFKKMGYSFQLNTCNDDIIVNGVPMSDIIFANIMYPLKNHGYRSKENAEIAWKYEASKNRFHPIADYLENLRWDGNDYIGKLCNYFEDEQNVFHLWIKRWLIGCVAKVLAIPQGQQNRMLILDGKQDIGKSYFVRWLCRPVPAYGIENPINPEDKDNRIRLMSKWIWEVSELGATTRKADREALKHFLTVTFCKVRK